MMYKIPKYQNTASHAMKMVQIKYLMRYEAFKSSCLQQECLIVEARAFQSIAMHSTLWFKASATAKHIAWWLIHYLWEYWCMYLFGSFSFFLRLILHKAPPPISHRIQWNALKFSMIRNEAKTIRSAISIFYFRSHKVLFVYIYSFVYT